MKKLFLFQSSPINLPDRRCIDVFSENIDENTLSLSKYNLKGFEDFPRFFDPQAKNSSPWKLFNLENVYVIFYPGLDGIVFSERNHYYSEQLKFYRKQHFNFLIESFFTGKISTSLTPIDIAFLPLDPGWNNYYHFLISVMPKLKMIDEVFHQDIPYLFPDYDNFKCVKHPQAFMPLPKLLEVLEVFKIDASKIIFMKAGVYKIKNLLLIANYDRLTFLVYSKYVQSIFLEAAKNIDTDVDYEDKKIFLSRKKSKTKRPIDILEPNLFTNHHQNFEKVVLDNLSFAEQISIFKSVKEVAGLHGAAFLNCMFSNGNISNMYEYMSETRKGADPRPHFLNVARAKKIPYSGQYIKNVKPKQ